MGSIGDGAVGCVVRVDPARAGWWGGSAGERRDPYRAPCADCRALFMVEDLFGELDVAFRAAGAGVVDEDGFAETGRFGQADAARDDGPEDLVAEELAEVGGHLAGEVGAVVVHGEEDAFDRAGDVEGVADPVDGIHEFGDALEGEELALDGNEDGIGGDQGVEGEEVEGGRAIDEDEVVVVADCGDAFAEAEFAVAGCRPVRGWRRRGSCRRR